MTNDKNIAIVGAGMSGLCMAIQLKKAGIDSFTIFEKSDRLGGTWFENTYPNAGCDVPSFLYSFSFEPKPDWSQKYSRQREILEYFRHCAEKYEIIPHIRYSSSVQQAAYSEETGDWSIVLEGGWQGRFDVVISAVGQLNRPALPEIEGGDTYTGAAFHTARWDADFDPQGKDIAIIGNGASAVQIVPEIAEQANHLYLYQRSPNWVAPLNNKPYSRLWQRLCACVPLLAQCYRWWLFWVCDSRFVAFRQGEPATWIYTNWLSRYVKRQVRERSLLDKLLPTYPAGCKRILLSDDYYAALQRDDVSIVTDPIQSISAGAISTDDAQPQPVDAIIYATGFQTSELLAPMQIIGRGGTSLAEHWVEQPGAYLGILVPGFPNFFTLYGPNTNLGHNSIIFMVECQVRYILHCLRAEHATTEVSASAAADYQDELRRRLERTVWMADCSSWYKDASGTIINNWCGPASEYYLRTRTPKWQHFENSIGYSLD